MDKKNYRTSFWAKFAPALITIAVFALVLYFVLSGLQNASSSADSEGIRIAEESIRRAVVNSYAMEGVYPSDYEYLKQHYGLSIDENKYIVHYEIFASNIMPDITVIKIER